MVLGLVGAGIVETCSMFKRLAKSSDEGGDCTIIAPKAAVTKALVGRHVQAGGNSREEARWATRASRARLVHQDSDAKVCPRRFCAGHCPDGHTPGGM